MRLLAELRRRNVIRMAGLYLVGAWLVVQVAGTLLPMFDAPPGMVRSVVLLLAIGFVPALVFAWVFELTPEGIKRDAEVPPEASIAPQTARRMDRMIIAVLALALLYFAVDKFVLSPARQAALATASAAAAPPRPAASAPAISPKSIAVLAFTDLSPQHDQEYFSDGIAEEILNALAHVKDLKVAGRTSSFYYKGRNEDLRSIGRTLGVAHVLEGSVRKQGDKVRITAQLIRSADGFHLWSESYDGDLKDVFQLQEQIARAVTASLKAVLEGEQKQRLVPVATASPEAYALYLQATAVFNRRDGAHFADAIADLQRALRLDPGYARAYSRLSALHVLANNYAGLDRAAAYQAARREAAKAMELDPSLAEPLSVLGVLAEFERDWLPARELHDRALALDPGDVTANFWLGLTRLNAGYLRDGLAGVDNALAIDPLLPNALGWRAFFHLDAGERDTARQMAQRAQGQGLRWGDTVLGLIAHAEGRDTEALAHLQQGLTALTAELPPGATDILAQGFYGDASQRQRARAMLEAYVAGAPRSIPTVVPWFLLMTGDPTRALEIAQDPRTTNDTLFVASLWSQQGAAARRLPQFPGFARKMGMTAVWDKYGAPDECRRIAPGDYRCD
jgi:TolB-like protein/Tfp pilus assembly protein PilF